MEIEYIYPDDDKNDLESQIKQIKKENTIGCLIMGLLLLSGFFIFLSLLPIILMIIGYSIIFLSVYIIYKAYLEDFILSLIQKLKR